MRLKKKQKEAVLEWIAEGLQTDEINKRAADFNPPFSVTRSNVSKYRATRKLDLDAIKKVSEKNALSAGFALKEYRVLILSRLAEMMAKDIFGGFLWTEEVKGVGSGPAAEVVDYEEFNRAEVEAFRGVLDDIAAEMGARTKKIEGMGEDGAILVKMIEVIKQK
jgi:hypothetical protein